MMKKTIKKAVVLTFAGLLAFSLPTAGSVSLGAPSNRSVSGHEKVWGRLLISAGPELSISYDQYGDVLEVKGVNPSGKEVLEGAGDYTGEDCDTAVKKLVKRLDDKGWLDKDSEARTRSLIIKSEKGSVYPKHDFMTDIEHAARAVIDSRNINVHLSIVDHGQLDDRGYIGKDAAEKIILKELGIKAEDLTRKEYDLDDGVYEMEVKVDGVKIEVDVDAVTGKILKIDRDNDGHDDRWDDDRYDDDHDDDDRYDDDHDDDRHDDDDDDRYDDDDRDDDDRYDDHDDDDRYDD